MPHTYLVEKILIELNQAGISLSVAGDKLRLHGKTKQLSKILRQKVVTHKPEIMAYLSQIKKKEIEQSKQIQKSKREGHIPLSFAQQRLWFLDQLEPDNAFYNMSTMIRLEGRLHVVALEQSFTYLTARHESLRTTFDMVDGQPMQVIHEPTPFSLTVMAVDDLLQAQAHAREEATRPFNLSQERLLRVQLLKIADTDHLLLLTMHHIITDGWSNGVLVKELSHAYSAYVQGNRPTLPALPIQYADFAIWQRQTLDGDRLDRQLSFWRKKLQGAPALLELPTDRPRPLVQSYRGANYAFELDGSLTAKLNQLAQSHEATLFMVLLTAFNVLLSRYSGQSDVVVGTPIANRNRAEIEGVVGFFVNTLVLRTELDDNPSFSSLLSRVRQTTLAAYDHQDLPFEQLVDELQLERTLTYSPLFQVMFALQNATMDSFALPDPISKGKSLTATEHPFEFSLAKFDLTLDLIESNEGAGTASGLHGVLEYNTDLFDEATITRMASHFTVLLNNIVSKPDCPVRQLPMLTEAEYHQIVHEWNDTTVDFGGVQTIHALFEQQVECTPDGIALIFNDQELTYAELNARANQVAHHLASLGIGPEELVGLCVERSIEMMVGLFGILKSGAAYLPLDPANPQERLTFMLQDAAASTILTQEHLVDRLPTSMAQVICLDKEWPQIAWQSQENPETQVQPNNLVYVIYTSGSTGQPKGVMIEHHSLAAFSLATKMEYELTPQDRVLQFSAITFDGFCNETFPYFISGCTIVLRNENMLHSHQTFIQQCDEWDITILIPPTAFWHHLTNEIATKDLSLPSSVRLLTIGGEKAQPVAAQLWQEHVGKYPKLVNEYGPTEATVLSSRYEFTERLRIENGQPMEVPIGRPTPNVRCYILDTEQHPVPIGVIGELYIGGGQLSRGYLNRPTLTAERFIEHQYGRLYKTGDLCRWLPDGNMEFIGRSDFQVKIRGFRIELGEIESALLTAPGVREAVVLAREDHAQRADKRLVAYIVTEDGMVGDGDTETLRQHLAQRLPDYMVPALFVELETMPLTQHGKLDLRALPEPSYVDAQTPFVAPRNEVEASLAQAFEQVLRIPQARPDAGGISIHDNFFRMGGDSILSIQLASRVAQQGYTLSVKDLFQHPTIAQLATVIGTEQAQVDASQEQQIGDAPLLPIQRWFLELDQAEMHHFNQSVLLTVKQPLDILQLEDAIRVLLRHHDALRCKFRQDEFGWHQQYLAQGHPVALEIVDLQALVPQEYATDAERIEAICSQTQASLNPLTGDLVRWVYFKTDDASADRLLIAIHHLVVDGVSWRILLEDFVTRLDGGQLAPKTSSYRDWVETLQSATENGHFDADIDHWLSGTVSMPLPLDDPDALNSVGNSHDLTLTLSQTQTKHLLRTLPDLHDVTLDSVLLTALTETLTDWSGNDALRVKFESHGRQELFDTINLNRTVGWFTSAYPLSIARFSGSAVKRIRYTLDQLRQVTDGGIGFGALHYFHPDEAIRQQFETLPSPQVLYNYLGQLDNLHNERFGSAKESTGSDVSPDFRRDTLIESNALVQGGQLHINWTVSPQISRDIAESLLHTFKQQLEGLISAALHSTESVAIPTDFSAVKLSIPELETLQGVLDLSNVQTVMALSPMQVGMLFHSQLAPHSGSYIEQTLLHIDDASFDLQRLVVAIQRVIDRHDALRATFHTEGLSKVQVVHPQAPLPVTYIDWRTSPAQEQQARLSQLISQDILTDFDFSQAPLFRLTVVQQNEHRYDLLFTFHHILMDRWSVDLFWSEVLRSYAGQTLPNAVPYQSYIQHLHQQSTELAFWQHYLSGFYAPTPLPGATTSIAKDGHSAAITQTFSLSATLKLMTFARTQGLTVNTVFQAAWAVLLARYARESDVLFGMVTSGRTAPVSGIESIVGLFINTLPFRVQLDAELTSLALLQQVSQTQLELQEREHTALVDVQRWSDVPAGTPLFDSLFLFQNTPETISIKTSGINVRSGQIPPGNTGYSLVALVEPGTEKRPATLALNYDTAKYDAHTAERLLTHWQQLVMAMVSHPEQAALQLPMLTDAESHQMVHEFNDTAVDFGEPQTIHALFEQQVMRTPDAVALIFEDEQLTYAELNLRANQLAHELISLGVQADTLVAVAMERSIEMIVSLLAILKADGAYVPIDPTYPAERIRYMLSDSAAPILLTHSHLLLNQYDSGHVMAVDTMVAQLALRSTQNPQSKISPEHLAYVIYTSGSTGYPKGVAIEHRGAFNYLQWCLADYGVSRGHGTLVHSPLAFDLTVTSIWSPLLVGRSIRLLPESDSIDALADHFKQLKNASFLKLTPAHLKLLNHQLEPKQFSGRTQALIIGGEALHHSIVAPWREFAPETRLINEYGPTEAVVGCVVYTVADTDTDEWVKIGRPIANTRIYILDDYGLCVPIGVAGELHIGGAQLARGYLNRPELTAERFIEHPQFGRLYKTGDLCRWLPSSHGNIEFLGRTDFQVKIRGFRIELGEIENALLAQDGVREAVVLAREDNARQGDKRLVAYVVGNADSHTLRQHLSQRLPDYMVPVAFVRLNKMPLTPNGKVDRRALPAPDYVDVQSTYVPPRNEMEASLAQAFAEVLRLPTVGIHDHFFRIGGDSILSIQLVSRAAQLGYTFSVKDLFEQPTIAQLVTVIRTEQPQIHASQDVQKGDAPLLPIQRWFLALNQPDMHTFNQSFLLTVKEPIEPIQLEAAIRALLRHHDALRFRYGRDESGRDESGQNSRKWRQRYLAPEEGVPLEVVDLRAVTPERRSVKIEAISKQALACLNPLMGHLMRWVYFKTDDEDRLLIIIHHLAVDGVSWHILLEDFATLLDGGQLAPKTSSYRDWVETLQSATENGYFDAQIRHWLAGAAAISLPLDKPNALNTAGNSRELTLTLSHTQTEQLLRTLPDLHDVTLDSVLLTALTETLTEWSGDATLRVKFESHGRQELFGPSTGSGQPTINLNRTVGWFTSLYPLSIARFSGSALKRIRYTLDQLRQVTDGGISFGALHYFHPDKAIREQFEALPTAQVLYNYLGQLDHLDNDRFGTASESTGLGVSPNFIRDTLLDCNALVQGGQLHINWTVSPQLSRNTAQSLLDTFAQQLDSLIANALMSNEWIPIRSDFPDANLSFDEFQALMQASNTTPKLSQIETIDREVGSL